jgi:hypothetical protein
LNASAIVDSIRISEVWAALGGDPLRRCRGKAFWRDGDGYNISLNDQKGCWYDFRDNAGGGMLDLICLVLQCDRASAIAWLSDYAGMPLDSETFSTPQHRRAAEIEAELLLAWRAGVFDSLLEQRNFSLKLYHGAKRYIIRHGLDAALGSSAAHTAERHEAEYQEIDEHLDVLRAATWDTWVALYRQEQRSEAA